MATFAPFRAWRYADPSQFNNVIAPPYDVLSPADVQALAAKDPYNIVHVDVPSGTPESYQQAADLLKDWIAAGVLTQDPEPSYTIYRMRFIDAAGQHRDVAGVFGALEVVDLGAGRVLPHERTTPKASTDRLDLTRATNFNMSAVWGLSLANGLTALLQEPGEPMGTLTVDGVEHTVERVSSPERVAAITACIAQDDVLIADGHHRYGVARAYRDELRALAADGAQAASSTSTAPGTPNVGEAELTLTFINELVADQLSIDAIHRIYTDTSYDQLRADLSTCFDFAPAPALPLQPEILTEMVELGRLVLLGKDRAEWMIPKAGVFADVRSLDGAWLEHALANSQSTVDYQHGLAEVQERVNSGNVDAAVLIRQTSLEEIRRTAREGLLMPPKSTFFNPKLRTGLVMRPLD